MSGWLLVTAPIVLLGIAIVLLAAALLVVMRRGGGATPAVFQQQLVEVRDRLDAIRSAQLDVPKTLAEGSAEQLRSLADVREQLARLSDATARLEAVGQSVAEVQDLLRVPQLRGTLGELWLEELLRQVLPSSVYKLQHSFRSGERVDAVIRVGERLVPVDSKFPLEACQRWLRAGSEGGERERRAFRRSLLQRVDEIADKYIKPEEGTYNFALMYVPAENVYYEAVIRDQDLSNESSVVGYALRRRVIPVSPNTFYAYLVAILHGLRGLEVQERARHIMDSIAGLAQQFEKFETTHELVGKHLGNALKQFDESDRQLGKIEQQFQRIAGVGEAGASLPPQSA